MPDLATLSIVQQVLRGTVLALVVGGKLDALKMAEFLHSFASNPEHVDPIARQMLQDLALGLDPLQVTAQGANPKH